MSNNPPLEPAASPTQPAGAVTIYTPKGQAISLPKGATLLDLAVVLHADFVATARGGRRNGERIGLLERLRDQDRVEIEIGRTQRPLPHDWEAHVTPEYRQRIRDAFRSVYRRTLEQRGMIYLQRRLIEAGAWPLPDETTTRQIIADILHLRQFASQRRSQPGGQVDTREMLIELGILQSKALRKLPMTQQIDDTALEQFLLDVFLRCMQIAYNIDEDGDMTCCACTSDALGAMVGERVGKRIVWHSAHEEEHAAVRRTRRIPLAPPPTQYLVLEGHDQVGLVTEIGIVFEIAGVDITEMLAIALPDGGARVRIRIAPTSTERIQSLSHLLRTIDGISEILDPTEPVTPNEDLHFPPRSDPSAPRARIIHTPYDLQIIHSPDRLYGRGPLLDELVQRLDVLIDPASRAHRFLYLYGGYKRGKSSVASTLFGMLAKARDDRPLWVRLDADPDESWRKYERRMMDHLLAELKLRRPDDALLEVKHWPTLADLVGWIRNEVGCPVLLGIDEVTSLFSTTTDKEEAAAAAAVLGELDRIRGTAIVLIGPDIESRHTPLALNRIVRFAKPIEVTPLAYDACKAIAKAQKTRHSISANEKVLSRIFWETHGNPYWTQVLCAKMWEGNVRTARRRMIFTDEMLTATIQQAMLEFYLFDQHCDPFIFGDEATDVTRITLAALATFSPTEPRKGASADRVRGISSSTATKRVTFARLAAYVKARVPAEDSDIHATLSAMNGAGTATPITTSQGLIGWHMPPLLNRHLRISGKLKGLLK